MRREYKQITNLEIENSKLRDQLSHSLQELEGVYHLVKTTPNDMELGKRVRSYYFENTEEASNQLNLLDDTFGSL